MMMWITSYSLLWVLTLPSGAGLRLPVYYFVKKKVKSLWWSFRGPSTRYGWTGPNSRCQGFRTHTIQLSPEEPERQICSLLARIPIRQELSCFCKDIGVRILLHHLLVRWLWPACFLFFLKNIYLFYFFIWPCLVLVAAHGTFNLSCSMQDLAVACRFLVVACGIY